MSTSANQEPELSDHTRQAAIVVEISNTQGFLDVNADSLARLVEGILRDEGIEARQSRWPSWTTRPSAGSTGNTWA